MQAISQRLEYFSDWHRVKRAIAICLRLRKRLRGCQRDQEQRKVTTPNLPYRSPDVEELRQAEREIIKIVQNETFPNEIKLLRRLTSNPRNREDVKDRKANLRKNSTLYRLDPFMDHEGLLRVGGRISRAEVPFHIKHPIILPRKGHVTTLVIWHFHQRVKHQGRGITLNEIREN